MPGRVVSERMSHSLLFYVNGKRFLRDDATVFQPLTSFLREEQRLTGTKVVCAEGACGACTVLVGRPETHGMRYRPLNACLLPLYQIAGCHVVTVEGLSNAPALSAVQEALVAHHGTQCGFCTPGMVMALTAHAEAGLPDDALEDSLCGNLCRCTGYLPILEAARGIDRASYRPLDELYPPGDLAAELAAWRAQPTDIEAAGRRLFIPTSLEEACRAKGERPEAVVVAGGTELGVQWNKQGSSPDDVICLSFITAQSAVACGSGYFVIDAGATWSQVEQAAQNSFPEMADLLRRFGALQVKNAGTVGGHICHGSPIGDALPLLCVLDARIEVVSEKGRREVPVREFLGPERSALDAGELVSRVHLPLPRQNQRLRLEKVSRRQGFDRSVVSAAMLLTCGGGAIQNAKLAFAGIAPHVCRLPRTEAFLIGRPLDEQTLCFAGDVLRAEITPSDDARGGGEYRSLLAANLLLRLLDGEEAA